MSRIIAQSVKRDGKNIIFSTQASEYHLNLLMNELQNIDELEVSIKKHKESRSVRQNKMLWAIMEKISYEINWSKREEDVMSVYRDLLKKANVKYVLLGAVKKAKPILDANFRFVEMMPNSEIIKNGEEFATFKCYIGSSQFDTKEMTELIDTALDYAIKVGVVDSELLSIREEYRL